VARLKCWLEVLTGAELNAQGAVQPLVGRALEERRRQLDALGGQPLP
jgi:hypothetical protein